MSGSEATTSDPIVQKTSIWSVLCLILGIMSLPACGCVAVPGIVCGAGAIGCWFFAAPANRSAQFSNASRTMATIGLVTGCIGLVMSLIYLVILALGLMAESGRSVSLTW